LSANGIEAVFFDLGGVIVDSPFDAFDRYERAHDLPSGFIRGLNATNPHDNAWAHLERRDISFDEFCVAFESEAIKAGGALDTRELFSLFSRAVRPEMVEAVRRCAAHFKTAALTNNFVLDDASGSGPSSQYSELLGLFDAVIESSKVGLRKPDPRFYLLACEILEVEPKESVFLDDLGVNLKPARALGMITIKVETTDSALAELEAVVGIRLRSEPVP